MSPSRVGGPSSDQLGDPALAMLCAEPWRVLRPQVRSVPFVFASPHSGRLYPANFIEASRLGPTNLRRSEDAYVDELFASATDCGAPLILACFPRAYVDANRAPSELDAAMFTGPLPFAVDRASPRVHAGLGVIPRVVRDGAEIYRDKLTPREAEERIARLYGPYHAQLAQLAEEARARFGMAIVIDCHSMPSAASAPDIVLGDRSGASAASFVTDAAERAFGAQGFKVARNAPYSGGHTTQVHGRPGKGSHALQIEINRGLYLDEENVERGPRFADIRGLVAVALQAFIAQALAGLATPRAEAAE